MALAEVYLRTKWQLDLSSRLSTTDMDRKLGDVPICGAGFLSNTMWPGSPPYQVASLSMQPFGHNRHEPKIGVLLCPPLFWGGSWVPI